MTTSVAVDAVLTAETLIEQFQRIAPQLSSPLPGQVSKAIAEAEHVYPEIWASLDRARAALGHELPAYDELRARQPAALMGVTKVKTRDPATQLALYVAAGSLVASLGAKTGSENRAGILDAIEAVKLLRAELPDVEWKKLRADNARTAAAFSHALDAHRGRNLAIGFALVAALVLAVFGITKLIGDPPKPKREDPAAVAARGIDELRARLAKNPCEAPSAELLVKKLRIQGHLLEAKTFGQDFLARCGDNEYIRSRVGS